MLDDPKPIAVIVGLMVIAGAIGACAGQVWGYIMLAVAFLICLAAGSSISR